jgi:hypothetical protein
MECWLDEEISRKITAGRKTFWKQKNEWDEQKR